MDKIFLYTKVSKNIVFLTEKQLKLIYYVSKMAGKNVTKNIAVRTEKLLKLSVCNKTY